MYKYLLLLVLCNSCFGDESRLHQQIGQIVVNLSQSMMVSVVTMDSSTVIYSNAKIDRVGHAAGKTAASGTNFENEFVPTNNGIVIRIYGELDTTETQKDWRNSHDEKLRIIERVIPTDGKLAIMLTCNYGSEYDISSIDSIIGLTSRWIRSP